MLATSWDAEIFEGRLGPVPLAGQEFAFDQF